MPTSRPFAYNNGSVIPGTTQVGNLAIGPSNTGNLSGSVTWYNGPDEELGYVICAQQTLGTQPVPGGGSASIQFWRSATSSSDSFIALSNFVSRRHGSPQNFTNAASASTWLNSNGYWHSYSQLVTSGLTLRLSASDSGSYPGSGTVWYDLAPPQQNITLINSPTYTSTSPGYFTFNGTNQRGSGATGTGVLPQTQYTKSVWFYLNANADNNLVSSDTGGHFMYFASGNKIYSGHANWNNYAAYPSTATFSLNTWYYAALTFNTTDGMKLYVNGVLDSTYTANKTAHTGDGSVNIASFGGGNFLNGRISKVYCYNRSLTAGEVLDNFNADKAQFGF